MEKYVVVHQALLSKKPDEQLELLQSTRVLGEVFPEVQAMVGFGGQGQGHKDLWEHTKQVVAQAVPEPAVRWAALFHDVGKVQTFSRDSGKVTFHAHEVVSARMFDRAARRVGIESAFRKHVRFLIRHLGYIESYESSWTDSAVRRMHKELGDYFPDTLSLARADITTKRAEKRRGHHARMSELKERAESIAREDAKLPLLPKGLGTVLIRELALTPGPRVGELMAELETAVGRGELPPRAEPEVYIEYLQNPPDSAKTEKVAEEDEAPVSDKRCG